MSADTCAQRPTPTPACARLTPHASPLTPQSLNSLCSGGWAYVIGTAAGIAATLDPNSVLYHTTMDHLNYFMRDRELPKEMRLTLRDYFQSARGVHQVAGDSDLLAKMSPLLQGTVACRANKPWLDQVWFLRDLNTTREEREFIAELSMKMQIAAYISNERMPIGQLYVLRKGMVVRLWRFLGPNSVWGEDMLLESVKLICHAQAVALTYVEVFTLSKPAFEEVSENYSEPLQKVSKMMRRVSLQRSLLSYLMTANGFDGAKSFVGSDRASGYAYVPDIRSVPIEKKLENVITNKLSLLTGWQSAAQPSSKTSPLDDMPESYVKAANHAAAPAATQSATGQNGTHATNTFAPVASAPSASPTANTMIVAPHAAPAIAPPPYAPSTAIAPEVSRTLEAIAPAIEAVVGMQQQLQQQQRATDARLGVMTDALLTIQAQLGKMQLRLPPAQSPASLGPAPMVAPGPFAAQQQHTAATYNVPVAAHEEATADETAPDDADMHPSLLA